MVLGGGVLTAGHALLMDEITRLLADQAPLAVARVVEAPPIVGAACSASTASSAADGAQQRLRESFHPRALPVATREWMYESGGMAVGRLAYTPASA